MKRSKINKLLKENIEFIKSMNFNLPPFAYFTPHEWEEKGKEYDEIRKNMLGWDVTDYGHGDFEKIGLFLFTIRNGNFSDPDNKKTYAEKLLISDENQYSPMHFHYNKMEDIINRGGNDLIVAHQRRPVAKGGIIRQVLRQLQAGTAGILPGAGIHAPGAAGDDMGGFRRQIPLQIRHLQASRAYHCHLHMPTSLS